MHVGGPVAVDGVCARRRSSACAGTIEAANIGALSPQEIAANQLQVDSILSTINRIAQSTSFNGAKLLNGSSAIFETSNHM